MSELTKIQQQKNDIAFKKDICKKQSLVLDEFLSSKNPDKSFTAFQKFLHEREYDKLIPECVKKYNVQKLERYADYLEKVIDTCDDKYDELEEKEEQFLGDQHFSFMTNEDFKDPMFREYYSASGGKSRRQKRREIRKKKREDKRAAKKAWEASGKKGGRAAWIKIKKQIKKKEREELAVYGGTFGKRLWKGLKKYSPTLVFMRNCALGMLKLNVFNSAYKIGKAKEKGVNNPRAEAAYLKALGKWGQVGGDKDSLEKAINVGKNKKPIKLQDILSGGVTFLFRKKEKKKFDGTDKKYFNIVDKVVLAAAITAGGTVITAILSLLKGTGDSDVEPDMTYPQFDENEIKIDKDETSYAAQRQAIIDDPYMTETEKEEALADLDAEEKDVPQWLINAGIVVGVLAGLSLITWGVIALVKRNKAKAIQ